MIDTCSVDLLGLCVHQLYIVSQFSPCVGCVKLFPCDMCVLQFSKFTQNFHDHKKTEFVNGIDRSPTRHSRDKGVGTNITHKWKFSPNQSQILNLRYITGIHSFDDFMQLFCGFYIFLLL